MIEDFVCSIASFRGWRLGGDSERVDQCVRVMLTNVGQQSVDQTTDSLTRCVNTGDQLRNDLNNELHLKLIILSVHIFIY